MRPRCLIVMKIDTKDRPDRDLPAVPYAGSAGGIALRVAEQERVLRPRAWIQLVAGLLGYAISIILMLQSGLGLGPWDAFHVGIRNLTGIPVGMASILAGIGLVAATLLIGVRPGPGTIANMILIGVFIDLLLPWLPAAHGMVWGLVYFVPAVLLCGLATGLYIGAGLGQGPRDGLMLGVSRRSGWPIRRARTAIELCVLLCGWLMGAPIGLGTLLFAFGVGPAVQWGMKLLGAHEA